jgi:hypothetical protein
MKSQKGYCTFGTLKEVESLGESAPPEGELAFINGAGNVEP